MSDSEFEFICPACEWQTDEPLICGHCYARVCRKCGEPLITIEEYRKAEKINAEDADREDRRLGL